VHVDQSPQLGHHLGISGGHVSFFGRIATQMKEYGRVMPLQSGLRIPRLCLKMHLPLTPTAGKQLVPPVIKKRSRREDQPLKKYWP
jgi:hypothetical protein